MKKPLLPDILIFQRFFKFAIAKRECVILARCPSHYLAARLGPSEVGEGGGEGGDYPLKVTGIFVALLGKENISFGCSIFNHTNHRGIVLWLCLKKYLNLIKHKPHPDCQLAFGFNSNFQRASSSHFHKIPSGYCPEWNFTRSEHDIVPSTVSSICFRFRRSTW